MLNQVVVVGRLVEKPKLEVDGTARSMTNITIAVPRSYKNENGDYECDYIDCVLWKGVAENAVEYCKKGDILGIRGRLKTEYVDDGNKKQRLTFVIAEKVSFLSTNKSSSENDN